MFLSFSKDGFIALCRKILKIRVDFFYMELENEKEIIPKKLLCNRERVLLFHIYMLLLHTL